MGDKQPPVGHYIDKDGYRWLTMQQGHPLAGGSGGLAEHRKVLYEKIGPGEHSCHWCGKSLGWGTIHGIIADHLDGDILNNDPNNLVASCFSCNMLRAIGRLRIDNRCSNGHDLAIDGSLGLDGYVKCRGCARNRMRRFRERKRHGREESQCADVTVG